MSDRLRIGLLLAAALLPYSNSLWNAFTLDDDSYILQNPAVTSVSLKLLLQPSRVNDHFRPVTFGSFALNWAIGGARPFGYHLLNLLMHAAVTLLLYFALRALFESVSHGATMAFAAALLFAVHPLHTEAVASVVGRAEILAAGFVFSAWLLHLGDRPILALLCYLLALLSKESAVAFVPLVIAGDYLRDKRKPLLRYLCIIGCTFLYFGVFWKLQGGRFGGEDTSFLDNPLGWLPATWRILNAFRIGWKYVALLLFPSSLSCDYSHNAIPLYVRWRYVLVPAVAAIAFFGLWLWVLWKRRTPWALAGALYFAGFAVTANIFVPTGTIMGERLAYLPSAGFCLLVGILWARLENRRPTLAWAVLGLVLAAFGARTLLRNRDWHDNYTLFSSAVRVVPGSSKMHSYLGTEYARRGQVDLARQEFEAALRIYPDFPEALEEYGTLESRLGRVPEARRLLQSALNLSNKGDIYYAPRVVNLVVQLMKLGENDAALALLNPLTADFPSYSHGWSNRAVIEFERGDLASARSDGQTALHLDPWNSQARNLLRILDARK